MVAFLASRRKAAAWIFTALSALALAGCDASLGGGPLVGPGRTVKVGLLVPKTSPAGAALAQSLENAARLAVNDVQGARIELAVYDTQGSAAGAAYAARQALNGGAKILLGPLYAEAANAAGQVARGSGVNVLSFSNNPTIAGGNVFILGNTFQTSADRLVRYAVGQGRSDIYIVHAQDPAEELGRGAIERAIQANGARLAGVGSFPLSQQGVIETMPGIARDIRASGATAVFTTSGTAGALPFVAQLLPENGVTPDAVQLIGLQRLDIPATALSMRGLQGAWFAAPAPGLQGQFSDRYQAAFGERPSPVAGLAYDGIAAIGALVASGQANALTVDALTQGAGFAGVNGPFRFFRNGTNERGLAVAQVLNNQVIVIDPAPASFGAAGF